MSSSKKGSDVDKKVSDDSSSELMSSSEETIGGVSTATVADSSSSSEEEEVVKSKKKDKAKKKGKAEKKKGKRKPVEKKGKSEKAIATVNRMLDGEGRDDEGISTIRVKMECASMKTAFEILNVVSPEKCNLRFRADGFFIVAESKSGKKKTKKDTRAHQKCEVEYFFPANKLSNYKFLLLDNLGNTVPSYDTCVCTTTFHHQIKNLKKGCLVFRLDVDVTNRSDEGITIINGSNKNHVPPLTGKNRYPKLTKFAEYYTGVNPCAKPINPYLDTIMVMIKNNKCEEVEIRHYPRTGNTIISGWNSESLVPVVTIPLDNKTDNSSMEDDDPMHDMNIKKAIYTTNSDWIYKMGKLGPGILDIYLDKDDAHAPLGFQTSIGSQGTATISIRSI